MSLQADAIKWKAIHLSASEARMLAIAAHSLRFKKGEVAPPAEKLLQPRRDGKSGTDLWSTYQRIQENIVRGGLRTYTRDGRKKRTRPVFGEENTRINHALWALAAKMAELKKSGDCGRFRMGAVAPGHANDPHAKALI